MKYNKIIHRKAFKIYLSWRFWLKLAFLGRKYKPSGNPAAEASKFPGSNQKKFGSAIKPSRGRRDGQFREIPWTSVR
jgi:hypothetical protein